MSHIRTQISRWVKCNSYIKNLRMINSLLIWDINLQTEGMLGWSESYTKSKKFVFHMILLFDNYTVDHCFLTNIAVRNIAHKCRQGSFCSFNHGQFSENITVWCQIVRYYFTFIYRYRLRTQVFMHNIDCLYEYSIFDNLRKLKIVSLLSSWLMFAQNYCKRRYLNMVIFIEVALKIFNNSQTSAQDFCER